MLLCNITAFSRYERLFLIFYVVVRFYKCVEEIPKYQACILAENQACTPWFGFHVKLSVLYCPGY